MVFWQLEIVADATKYFLRKTFDKGSWYSKDYVLYLFKCLHFVSYDYSGKRVLSYERII